MVSMMHTPNDQKKKNEEEKKKGSKLNYYKPLFPYVEMATRALLKAITTQTHMA